MTKFAAKRRQLGLSTERLTNGRNFSLHLSFRRIVHPLLLDGLTWLYLLLRGRHTMHTSAFDLLMKL